MSISCKSARTVGVEARAGAGARYPSHVRRLRRGACARASPDAEAVFYGVLDVLAKPGFGALPLWGHRNIGILPSLPLSRRALSRPYIHTYHQPANADLPTRANRHARSRPPHPRRRRDPRARREDGRVDGLMRRRGENGASNGAGMARSLRVRTLCAAFKPGADAEGEAALAARWMGWSGLGCLL